MPGVIPEKVNPDQSKAIKHGRGPLLIVAGAGTGKTTVITERIAHLIINEQVPSDNILALTFTNKAAGEMQDRVERILPFGYVDLWVMTFHSLGQRLLKEHALDIGLSNDFKLLSQTDQWLLIREHLDDFDLDYYRPLGNPTKFITALVKHFSRLKDEDISPAEYLKYAKTLSKNKTTDEEKAEAARIMELAKAYDTYNQLLLDNNALDFGDLILYTLRLLRERPAILKKYQQQFQYILVDEFQDTNWAQYELIKRLAKPRNNLTVVGDDDQSIYKFRGASVSNILEFKKDFADAEVIVLTKNYRTKQSILDLAHTFIQHNNPDRLEAKKELFGGMAIVKKLKAQREGNGEIGVIHVDTQEAEARAVADKVEELRSRALTTPASGHPSLDKEGNVVGWDSFCVLVRANDHAQIFINEFERRGMPHVFLAARGLFTKPLVIDLLAYLRLLDNYHESAALYRVLAIPVFGIDHGDVVELSYQAKKKNRSLYEQLLHDDITISDATRAGVKKIKSLIQAHTELANTKSVGEVLLQFLNDSGYLQEITKKETAETHEQTSYLKQLFKVIETFQQGERPATVKSFLKYIDHVTESGDAGGLEHDLESSGPDTIKIMTIHSAKGLEFPYVFIGNVVEQRFPGMDRKDPIPVPDALVREILPTGDAHVQEERRLMYVAITRARNGVFFTLAEDYGGQRRKKPSAFMYELGLLKPPVAAEKKLPLPAREFKPTPKQKKEVVAYVAREKQYSFTKLSTYNDCPWKYRYAFVLQVPKKGSYALSYGSSVHKTLFNFFALWKERAKDGQTVSEEELLTMYDRCFIDEWYPKKKLKNEYYDKGKQALTEWYAKILKAMPNVLRLEQVFNLKVDEFVVNGAVDRIDQIGGTNEKPEVKIVDYKTGKVKEKFEKDDKYQLLIYALAVQDPNILNAEVKELEYYFIDENESRTMTPTEKDSAAAKEWVSSTIKKIHSGDFRATPSEMVCKFCDYREICEFRAV